MKILVATKNNAKIEGVKKAFNTFFENIDIIGVKTESDVPDQPINGELKKGVENRIKNLKRYAVENNIECDYYVSVEAGIVDYFEEWMNIQLVLIENENGEKGLGSSPGYSIPRRYINKIKETNLAELTNEIFGKDDERHQNKGTIQLLTKNNLSRVELIEQSTMMALTKFINGDKWKD